MDIEQAAFDTIMAMQEKAGAEGREAFETVESAPEPLHTDITEKYYDDRAAVRDEIDARWDALAERFDDRQRALYDEWKEITLRLRGEVPQDDRDLLRDHQFELQMRLGRTITSEQLPEFREIESIERHWDSLRDESSPVHAHYRGEEESHTAYTIAVDGPEDASATELHALALVMERALSKYFLRQAQDRVADIDPEEDIEVGLIQRGAKTMVNTGVRYDADRNQLELTTDDPEAIEEALNGARLKQCVKNTLRELRTGWKKVKVTDPDTGEEREIARQGSTLDISDLHRGMDSPDYFFDLMAQVRHTLNWQKLLMHYDVIGESRQDAGAFACECEILDNTYFILRDDDQLRTPRYFAFQKLAGDEAHEDKSKRIENCVAMDMQTAKDVLGDILKVPEFREPERPGR